MIENDIQVRRSKRLITARSLSQSQYGCGGDRIENNNNKETHNRAKNTAVNNRKRNTTTRSSDMDQHLQAEKEQQIEITFDVPWQFVMEYLTFAEVLVVRQVCSYIKQDIDHDAFLCSQFLKDVMMKKNLFIVVGENNNNNNSNTNDNSVLDLSSRDTFWKDSTAKRKVSSLVNLLTSWSNENYNENGTTTIRHTHKKRTRQEMSSKSPAIGTTRNTTTTTSHVSPFTLMARTLRVFKYLPMEMAVAYSLEDGRHCLPLEVNKDTGMVQEKQYTPCQRRNCSTCNLAIPHDDQMYPNYCIELCPTALNLRPVKHDDDDNDDSVDDMFEYDDDHHGWSCGVTPDHETNYIYAHKGFRNEQNEFLDFTRYYNKCIPNLPFDLTCPVCQCQSKRTLVLSEFSYQSPLEKSGGEYSELTFTPTLTSYPPTWSSSNNADNTGEEDEETSGDDEDDSSDDDDDHDDHDDDTDIDRISSSLRRYNSRIQRTTQKKIAATKNDFDVTRINSTFPPPMYEDVAIPDLGLVKTEPDAKHAIAIHCDSCHKFGMFAPAGFCHLFDDDYAYKPACCTQRSEGKTTIDDKNDSRWIGGVFVRTKCSNPQCNHPVRCEQCCSSDQMSNGRCGACQKRYCGKCKWMASVCCHM